MEIHSLMNSYKMNIHVTTTPVQNQNITGFPEVPCHPLMPFPDLFSFVNIFFYLRTVPQYVYAFFLMDFEFSVRIKNSLEKMPLLLSMNYSMHVNMFSQGLYLGIELLCCVVCISSICLNVTKTYSKVIILVYTLTNSV